MSEVNSTPSSPSGKPSKPSPDYPLFPHATKRWAKKIKGKMHYFGKWDDPGGALRAYLAFVAGKPLEKPTQRPSVPSGKPSKPSPDYPLFPHATKRWAKKIKGKMHYFGKWDDPDAALARYLEQKDALHAGRKPRGDTREGVSVKDAVNGFLNLKKARLDADELSLHTWTKYRSAADEVIAAFGKRRLAIDLDAQDFSALRDRMSAKWGLHRLADMIQHVRSIFKHAYESGLLPAPMRFGPGFARPTKKSIRLHRAEQGLKLFSAEEIRLMLASASTTLRAMLLLGVNCGFGNNDCARLPVDAVDLGAGWIDFARPKTGVSRRCPLWPETVQAMEDALANRHEPKCADDAGLFFTTKHGNGWSKGSEGGPVSKETTKLLNRLGINGRKGLGFYTLRHTFRTVADESRDQPGTDHIMGHESSHMSSAYRESISDERLIAVSEYVRNWLFGDAPSA